MAVTDQPIVKHTCNDGQGPHFGRLAPPAECPRCDELRAGAPRRTLPWAEAVKRRDQEDAGRSAAMREHFASRRHNDPTDPNWCGPVCTAYDW